MDLAQYRVHRACIWGFGCGEGGTDIGKGRCGGAVRDKECQCKNVRKKHNNDPSTALTQPLQGVHDRVVLSVWPTGRGGCGGWGGMRAQKVCAPKMGISFLALHSISHSFPEEKFLGGSWLFFFWSLVSGLAWGAGSARSSPQPPPSPSPPPWISTSLGRIGLHLSVSLCPLLYQGRPAALQLHSCTGLQEPLSNLGPVLSQRPGHAHRTGVSGRACRG